MAPRLSSGLLVIFYAGMRKTFPLTTDCGVAAGLNYGDCFAYALAKAINEPLLFKARILERLMLRQPFPPQAAHADFFRDQPQAFFQAAMRPSAPALLFGVQNWV
jgi:hypothetical protein